MVSYLMEVEVIGVLNSTMKFALIMADLLEVMASNFSCT